MPNLFLIPQWLIIIYLPILVISLKSNDSYESWAHPVLIVFITFDQINFIISGSLIDPLKISCLLSYLLLFSTPKKQKQSIYFLKKNIYFRFYIAWIFVRDLIALPGDIGFNFAARYSLQFIVLTLGLFLASSFASNRFNCDENIIILKRMINLFFGIALIFSVYQYFAYKYGLPINGIRSLYSVLNTDSIKFAAFRIDGNSYFRSYGLNGEPKFLANLAMCCFAFILFLYKEKKIKTTYMVFIFFSSIILLILTASTSAMITFLCIIFMYFISSFLSFLRSIILPFKRKVLFKTLVVPFVVFSLLFVLSLPHLSDFLEARIYSRLEDKSSALESHEDYYVSRVLSSDSSFIFGLGYSAFAERTTGSVASNLSFETRLIPNNPVIFNMVIGGAINLFFYCMIFVRKFCFLPEMLIFLIPAIFYTVPAGMFILLIFSDVAVQHLQIESR